MTAVMCYVRYYETGDDFILLLIVSLLMTFPAEEPEPVALCGPAVSLPVVEEEPPPVENEKPEEVPEPEPDPEPVKKAPAKKKKLEQPDPKLAGRTAVYEVTAYTAGPESTGKRPGDPGYGITASGKKVQEGVTIACPKSLPFGTVIHIEGLGERVCQDRGGAIKENRLDVYFESLQEARQFGRQSLNVRIMEE